MTAATNIGQGAKGVIVIATVFAALVGVGLALSRASAQVQTKWTDETPSWSPDGRTIVFASNGANPRSAIDQLYTIRPDGRGLRRLTRGFDAREPSYSPTGDRIAFAANVLTSDNYYTERGLIYTISATVTDATLVSDGLPGDSADPAWSPDGRLIAFLNTPSSNSTASLYVVRPDGTGLRLVARNIQDWSFAWSPDGTRVAVAGVDGRLHVVPVDSREPAHFGGASVEWVTTDVAWSPNGKQLAYVRGEVTWDGSGDLSPRFLWMRDVGTGTQRRLREVVDSESIGGFQVTITWLRDRTHPLLAVFDEDSTHLVTPTGVTKWSIAGPSDLAAGSASPHGRRLVVVEGVNGTYRSALALVAANGVVRRITQR